MFWVEKWPWADQSSGAVSNACPGLPSHATTFIACPFLVTPGRASSTIPFRDQGTNDWPDRLQHDQSHSAGLPLTIQAARRKLLD